MNASATKVHSHVTQPTQPHTYRLAFQLINRSEENDEVQSEVQVIQNYLALSSNLTKLTMLSLKIKKFDWFTLMDLLKSD